jgi:hypothetical protein
MHRLIPLDKNIFGESELVILLVGDDQGVIHRYMSRSHDTVKSRLYASDLAFLYPRIISEADDAGIERMIRHYFPYASGKAQGFDTIRKMMSDTLLYLSMVGLEPSSLPCLLYISRSGVGVERMMRVFPLSDEDERTVDEAVSQVLNETERNRRRIQASAGGRQPYHIPLEREFEQASELLSARLKSEIENELDLNRGVGALKMLLFMFRGMRERGLRLDGDIEKLMKTLGDELAERPSRLIVGVNSPLKLPDYGKEVSLTPLQKTVYILFLNHEEGILFKDLRKHRDEILSIYRKLSNKSSEEEIMMSVDSLANPFDNSMSEKCARIKEAFLRAMDERLALHYYVRGGRNEPKRILIDRSLVEFEDQGFGR